MSLADDIAGPTGVSKIYPADTITMSESLDVDLTSCIPPALLFDFDSSDEPISESASADSESGRPPLDLETLLNEPII